MITIQISEAFNSQIKASLLEQAANLTLTHLSVPENTSMTIAITGDQEIQQLNRQFRDIDAPTDVLSFPAGYPDPESGTTYLGDIIISVPQAALQAERGGHPLEDELQLLVVHGCLHLLGHDHAEPAEKTEMWAAQKAILEQLHISVEIISEV
ncbi:MAG: rRNA maturation RNase YbeY [Anaerolineales bacterium]|nr:rRNA maturation RNase YbeY [Anaerolineales bacterium]